MIVMRIFLMKYIFIYVHILKNHVFTQVNRLIDKSISYIKQWIDQQIEKPNLDDPDRLKTKTNSQICKSQRDKHTETNKKDNTCRYCISREVYEPILYTLIFTRIYVLGKYVYTITLLMCTGSWTKEHSGTLRNSAENNNQSAEQAVSRTGTYLFIDWSLPQCGAAVWCLSVVPQ